MRDDLLAKIFAQTICKGYQPTDIQCKILKYFLLVNVQLFLNLIVATN